MREFGKIAIIAGKGGLARHIYDICQKRQEKCIIIGLKGTLESNTFSDLQCEYFAAYDIGRIIQHLKAEQVSDIVLAGKLTHKNIYKLLSNYKGFRLFCRILRGGFSNEALLRSVIQFLQDEGFNLIAPDRIAQEMAVPPGNITQVNIIPQMLQDIHEGMRMIREFSNINLARSLVIQDGLVLGVEAQSECAEDLISRCAAIRQQDGSLPILIRTSKILHQNQYLDPPCITPSLIESLSKNRFQGIAVEAQHAMILEPKQTLALADQYGIFIYGCPNNRPG